MSATLSINPVGETFTVHALPFTQDGVGDTFGLASVRCASYTIQSLDTEALRILAEAIVRAADAADQVTAQHLPVMVFPAASHG